MLKIPILKEHRHQEYVRDNIDRDKESIGDLKTDLSILKLGAKESGSACVRGASKITMIINGKNTLMG